MKQTDTRNNQHQFSLSFIPDERRYTKATMNAFSQYMYSVLRQVTQEFRQLASKCALAMLRTPLPRIFVICVAIALAISLIPFVLSLFVLFVVLRVFLGLLKTPQQDRTYNQQAQSYQEQRIYIRRLRRDE